MNKDTDVFVFKVTTEINVKVSEMKIIQESLVVLVDIIPVVRNRYTGKNFFTEMLQLQNALSKHIAVFLQSICLFHSRYKGRRFIHLFIFFINLPSYVSIYLFSFSYLFSNLLILFFGSFIYLLTICHG